MDRGNAILIWDRVGDYHYARYKALKESNHFSHVLLANLGASDALYQWQIHDSSIIQLSEKPVNNWDLFKRIKLFNKALTKHNISVVYIAGYGRLEYLFFILLAHIKGVKVILFAESWYGKNFILNIFKSLYLKANVDAFFVSGSRARNHFSKTLKLHNKKMEVGYSAVDNQHFTKGNRPKKDIILCVARYSKEKNLARLINAFLNSKAAASFQLHLVGDGPEKESLIELIKNDSEKVILKGWVNYDSLPALYQESMAFILPSVFEPWGLVVNEAMAAGLPIMISFQCGCQPELAKYKLGYVFDGYQTEEITKAFDWFINLRPEEYKEQQEMSKACIKNYDISNWANKAIKLAE